MPTSPDASAQSAAARTTSGFDQILAYWVQFLNDQRDAACVALVSAQELAFEKACLAIEIVRAFIADPEHILGSDLTKHGEIAENTEVGVRTAWDIFEGRDPAAHLPDSRTNRVDYVLDGVNIQSKFHRSANRSLSSLLDHLKKYPDFIEQNGGFVIPKDQFELIQKALAEGESGDQTLLELVKRLEAETGKSFAELVQSASVTYADVQLENIEGTLDDKVDELSKESDKRVEEIKLEHEPSFSEGVKAAAGAAAAAGGVSFVREVYGKYRKGKNIFKGDFTAEDWREVGWETSKGALAGGITGGALYAMTNCAKLSAPLAGAMVSAAKGLAPLVASYHSGKLSLEELVDTGLIVCSEVGMVAAATAVGQAVVPLPVVGALVGSVAGQLLASLLKGKIQDSSATIDKKVKEFEAKLNAQQLQSLRKQLENFKALGELTVAAFDVARNHEILAASAKLAQTYGVPSDQLLTASADVDRFMLA